MNNVDFKRLLAVELKKARLEAGMSQAYVLSETGIHVGRIEMGQSTINLCTFLYLCNFYKANTSLIINRMNKAFINTYKNLIVYL